ncbi:hypothetical protein M405DRAFT_818884 [Rhizopogon salebrosus TDB-379]|nr:hypothetical protein M405DRAFT_818884 [Rhizopogon salebrosus TDB-379]
MKHYQNQACRYILTPSESLAQRWVTRQRPENPSLRRRNCGRRKTIVPSFPNSTVAVIQ